MTATFLIGLRRLVRWTLIRPVVKGRPGTPVRREALEFDSPNSEAVISGKSPGPRVSFGSLSAWGFRLDLD
jgi:hypothetical protein